MSQKRTPEPNIIDVFGNFPVSRYYLIRIGLHPSFPDDHPARSKPLTVMKNLLVIVLCIMTLPLPLSGQDFETTEIASGVYQFRWVGHNAMFAVSDNRVVAFDPINSEAAAAFAGEIKRVVPNAQLAAIVYSHSDADHSTGAGTMMAAFGQENVPVIAHERAVAPVQARAATDHLVPTVTFAERMSFQLNGRKIELHYLGPSHTDNIAVAFIPDAGVAFSVDFVNHDRGGYRDLPGWQFLEFFDAMAGLLNIPFDTMIFGHGPVGDRGSIQRQIAYYDDVTAFVRKSIAGGLTEDQVAAQISLPQYEHWGQYADWMPLNARAIYRWLNEESGE